MGRLWTRLLAMGALLVAVTAAVVASEEPDPDNSLRVVVPCPAGSPADVLARSFATALAARTGLTVAVENASPGKEPSAVQRSADGRTMYFGPVDITSAAPCGE